MAEIWLSPGTVLALGWSLIHSLWQSFTITALATLLMAFSRRASTRYLIGVSALVLVLAATVTTFLVLSHGAIFAGGPQSTVLPVQRLASGALPAALQIRPGATASAVAFYWPPSRLIPLLVAAWLVGVALCSLRLVCGFLLLEQRRRWHSSPPAQRFIDLCVEVQDRLGLGRTVRYLECDWLQTPAAIGWLRPIVLLPVIVLTGLSEDQLRAVVAHELAHIQRLDCVVNFLQALVEALLFYNPAVWWLARRIRTERERCCDEIAISLYDNRLEYARALGLMGEWRSAPLLAMAANRGPLSERILCVLGREAAAYRPRPVAVSAGFLFLMAVLAASRVVPQGMFSFHHLPASALVQALARPDAAPRLEPKTQVAPAAAVSRQSLRGVAQEAQPISFPQTRRVHADPLPVLAETALAVAQPQMSLTPIAADKPTQQAASPVAVVPLRSDASPRDQPTGSGDPEAVTCREPERLPGSQEMGPRLCRENTYWFQLWIKGETLSADGKNVLQPETVELVNAVPDGEGNPDQVVCAKPQHQSASRLLTPTRCFRNAYWAQTSRNAPREIIPTDTGHRFLAVFDYPIGIGPAPNSR